jgi:hypothetical protein
VEAERAHSPFYGSNATPNRPALSAFGAINRFSTRRDLTKSTSAELPSSSSEINNPPAHLNGQAFPNSPASGAHGQMYQTSADGSP